MCRKLGQKFSIVSQRAKNRILRGCDGRPLDKTSNLSRPRAWIMESSALSPTLMWPCPERRGVTMGCLYLEIEGQSCLLDDVDQGLMKNRQIDLLDRRTQKRGRKKRFRRISPIAALPGIFQQITPPEKVCKLFGQTIGFPLT